MVPKGVRVGREGVVMGMMVVMSAAANERNIAQAAVKAVAM